METATPWKILVIDDEPDIREVVSLVLQDQGHTVRTADCGRQGIEVCETFQPQVVMTDVRMPGMDGLQVLEILKRRFEDTEVIVITAFGDLDLAIRALQLDASDFITKPVREDTLTLALNRAVQRYTSRKKLKDYARFLEQENLNQARMLHKDKLVSLGRLCASVVHEINNPLAGILNYARLMNRIVKQGPLPAERLVKFGAYLDLVESEASRISNIVSGLLSFSRKTEPVVSFVHVPDLMDKCILLCRHRLELGRIRLDSCVEDTTPRFRGDFNQIQQCIINLIFNAVDAMPEGGTLTLRGYGDPDQDMVVITVQDTGTGIAPEHLKTIFEPFFTTKKEGYGVGLGLSIVFGIMEQHGGGVDVRSEPGQGSVFTLRFPAVRETGGQGEH